MPFQVKGYIPSVPAGAYQAVCIDVEEKPARKDPTNIFRVWHFQLTDGSLRAVDGPSSLAGGPKSKGGKWLAALLGREPALGETVDPVGKPCTINVIIDDNGYEKVDNVMPPLGPVTVIPATEQPVIQEGDELP